VSLTAHISGAIAHDYLARAPARQHGCGRSMVAARSLATFDLYLFAESAIC
jgi:hypothetical protein